MLIVTYIKGHQTETLAVSHSSSDAAAASPAPSPPPPLSPFSCLTPPPLPPRLRPLLLHSHPLLFTGALLGSRRPRPTALDLSPPLRSDPVRGREEEMASSPELPLLHDCACSCSSELPHSRDCASPWPPPRCHFRAGIHCRPSSRPSPPSLGTSSSPRTPVPTTTAAALSYPCPSHCR
jgi:hypothetical protein